LGCPSRFACSIRDLLRAVMADTFTKAGLTKEDHHFKHSGSGKYQKSPPKGLKSMYEYLPTDDSPMQTQFHRPAKVSLIGEINGLKQQSHCMGTYVRIEGRESNGQPIYKHATADLVLAKGKIPANDQAGEAEDGWIIARWATFSVSQKDQRCMQISCAGVPWDTKVKGQWQEWGSRGWVVAPSVHLRPSYHGYGQGVGDASVHNSITASDEVRRRAVSPAKGRGRGRTPSPPPKAA